LSAFLRIEIILDKTSVLPDIDIPGHRYTFKLLQKKCNQFLNKE